jgi:hypothetical protein
MLITSNERKEMDKLIIVRKDLEDRVTSINETITKLQEERTRLNLILDTEGIWKKVEEKIEIPIEEELITPKFMKDKKGNTIDMETGVHATVLKSLAKYTFADLEDMSDKKIIKLYCEISNSDFEKETSSYSKLLLIPKQSFVSKYRLHIWRYIQSMK